MREALEAVIKDLESRSQQSVYMHDFYMAKGEVMSEMFNYGLTVAYEKARDMLKGVLANAPGDTRDPSDNERDHS